MTINMTYYVISTLLITLLLTFNNALYNNIKTSRVRNLHIRCTEWGLNEHMENIVPPPPIELEKNITIPKSVLKYFKQQSIKNI
jgi:hypothetical protein